MATVASAGTTPPPVDPDKQKDRDTSIQGSKLGVRGAVLAAVIGALSGVGASLITAHYATDLSHEEFMRSQRQTVYSQFLADTNKVVPVADAIMRTSEIERSTLIDLENGLDPLVTDLGQLQLVTTSQTAKAAQVLVEDLQNIQDQAASRYCSSYTGYGDRVCEGDHSAPRVAVGGDKILADRESYLNAARADLGFS